MEKRIICGIFFLFLLLSVTHGWATPTQFENCLREFKEASDLAVKNQMRAGELGGNDDFKTHEVIFGMASSKKEVERKKAEIISEIRRNPSETLPAMEKFLQTSAGKGSLNLFSDLIELNKDCLVTSNVMPYPVNKGVSVRNSVNTTSKISPRVRPARIEKKRNSGPVLTLQQQFEALMKLIRALKVEENRTRTEARNVNTPENIMKFIERAAQNQEELVRQILAIRISSPKLKQVVGNIVKMVEAQIASIRQTSYVARTNDKRFFESLKNDVLANNMKGGDLGGQLAKVAVEELGPEKAQALFKNF